MDLVNKLEQDYLPLFEEFAQAMRTSYPQYRFNVSSQPQGTRTLYQGHMLALECLIPEQPLDVSDSVAILISANHLTTESKLMAEVGWENGQMEGEFQEYTSSDDWPKATPEVLEELAASMDHLLLLFRSAVERGRPKDN